MNQTDSHLLTQFPSGKINKSKKLNLRIAGNQAEWYLAHLVSQVVEDDAVGLLFSLIMKKRYINEYWYE